VTDTSSTAQNGSSATAFDRFSGPGERHRALQPTIGDWRVSMSTTTARGEATRSDDIRSRKRWIGDGRYVREEVEGTFRGRSHSKLTLLGFNNIRGRYEYVTADNYDAAILLYVSSPGDPGDGRRIEMFSDYVYAGDGPEPTGTLVTIRTVIEIEGSNRHILRNYYGAPGQDEYLFLEYDYRRMP
jgi:hypothetical protein